MICAFGGLDGLVDRVEDLCDPPLLLQRRHSELKLHEDHAREEVRNRATRDSILDQLLERLTAESGMCKEPVIKILVRAYEHHRPV